MPIRVLHVVTYMGRGGLETMIMNYYRHIDRDKIQFDFLVHRNFRADYDDEIEALGGKIHRLPRLIPWNMNYRKALDNFFSNHPEYKIVHVHQDCLSSVILSRAKKHGVPVRIAHSHNKSQDKNLKYPIKLFYKHFIPHTATHLMACGKEAGDWMFGGAAYQILNNAINSKKFVFNLSVRKKIRTQLGINESTLVLGHIGRFHPAKNHTFLLDVFAQLQKSTPDSKLLLVGDGDLRTQIEEKAQRLGISNNVLFTGVREDIPELLQAMDVFVFPSIYEGLPVSIVEAQASGLPCLISVNVPEECKLTDTVQSASLNADKTFWVNCILDAAKTPRENTYDQICKSGFDIEQNAVWLTDFYLSECEKEN